MFLSRLYIENYRSIENIDLEFKQGKNIIVGRNNCGKSNILKAIDLVLGEYSPTYGKTESVIENDFHNGKVTKPIFIWCEISRETLEDGSIEALNLSEAIKNKSTFYRLYKDRNYSKEVRVSLSNFGKEDKVEIFKYTTEKGQSRIDDKEVEKKWIGAKKYCKATFEEEFSNISNFAFAFYAAKVQTGEIKKELLLLYRESPENDWIIGYNCNLRNSLLQSAIIPAFRDPKDQLRISTFSWFGKLLKSYVGKNTESLDDAFHSVKEASNELFKELREKISEKQFNIAFPNTSISFQFNPEVNQDIHKSALIYVNDGFNSELREKGAGIQSAVTISLFDFYVRHVAHSGSSLLAVEEPELYLHPHGRRVIANRLSKFVENGRNQVILTTHSPEFLTTIHETQNIVIVRKENIKSVAKNIFFNTPKRKQILIKKQNAELFFADGVILSEGADKYFIEEAARCVGNDCKFISEDGEIFTLGENWLNDNNVSVLNCGGKAELWKYAEILSEIGLKFVTTADFDFLRDGLNNYLRQLKFPQVYFDKYNSIRSKIGTGKIKNIDQVENSVIVDEVRDYLQSLHKENIFIFTGELEDFYIERPNFDKEGGVIETLGKVIEQSKPISEFIKIHEYEIMLKLFIKSFLGYSEYVINQDEVLQQ